MLKAGELIRLARVSENLSKKELSEKLEVSDNYLYLIEKNVKEPGFKLLKRVSEVLDIPLVLLIYEKLDPPKPKTKEEREIYNKLNKMIRESQDLFANKIFKVNGKA